MSLEYIEWAADQLPGDDLLIEFRHRSWLDDENRAQTLSFLESRGLTYVIVDAPKTDAKNLVPTVVARTSKTAYVRFHGRNASTWNKRTGSAADRFDYLYSEQELEEWVEPLQELALDTESVYAMFNNNGRSEMPSTGLEGIEPEEIAGDPAKGEVAQAPANALMLRRALGGRRSGRCAGARAVLLSRRPGVSMVCGHVRGQTPSSPGHGRPRRS